MEKTFKLEIITPLGSYFSGAVSMVQLPGVSGQLGILPGHADMLSMLEPGITSYISGNKRTYLVTGSGFVEVDYKSSSVAVVVEIAEGRNDAPFVPTFEIDNDEYQKLLRARTKLATILK